jgi:hypothetical protein
MDDTHQKVDARLFLQLHFRRTSILLVIVLTTGVNARSFYKEHLDKQDVRAKINPCPSLPEMQTRLSCPLEDYFRMRRANDGARRASGFHSVPDRHFRPYC